MIDEQISPELVLVDPELAARVRPFAVAGPTIVVPPPSPEIAALAPAPEIAAPAPAPEIAAPAPAPEITAPAPAPEITAPAPAPEITAPAPAPDVAVPPPAPDVVVVPPEPAPWPVESPRLRPPEAEAPAAAQERPEPARPALERPARPHRRRGHTVLVRALPSLAALAILCLAFLSPRNAPSLTDDTASPPSTPRVAVRPIPPQMRATFPTRVRARTAGQQATTQQPRPRPAKTRPQAAKTRPPSYSGPSTLTWRPRSGADYYVVELFVRDRLVHAASVRRPAFAVPAWLPTGRYSWRVLAGKGAPSDRRTTVVVEHGWFIRS